MFLSIDAGNSNIVFGFYQELNDSWEEVLRIPTKKDLKVFKLIVLTKLESVPLCRIWSLC